MLATDCGSGDEYLTRGRWLLARDTSTGAEVFKVALPAKEFDPSPIREMAGLFLVQAGVWGRDGGNAFLIDRKGKLIHHFGRTVLAGERVEDDCVFLTGHGLLRITPGGKEVWTIPLDHRGLLEPGALIKVQGGDLLSFRYGAIHDSGVEVRRFDPKSGKTRW